MKSTIYPRALLALTAIASLAACSKTSSPEAKQAPAASEETTLHASGMVDAAGRPLGEAGAALADGNMKIWYADLGDSLGIRMLSPSPVILHIDVNHDGRFERLADRTYGMFADGTPCIQLERERSESSACGEVPSGATSYLSAAGGEWDGLWKIPKAELGTDGRAGFAAFSVYDPDKGEGSVSGMYRLPYGKPALTDTSVPPPPVREASEHGNSGLQKRTGSQLREVPAERTGTSPALPGNQTQTPSGPPFISVFTAEPERVEAGQTAHLAWTVANASTVTLEPGPGSVPASGKVEVQPTSTTRYLLSAVGPTGAVETKVVRVELVEPVAILAFTAQYASVVLGETIVLEWQTKGATDVVLDLVNKPAQSAFQYDSIPQPAAGRIEIPVTRRDFTRYGNYEFQLVARGLRGPVSRRISILVKPADRVNE